MHKIVIVEDYKNSLSIQLDRLKREHVRFSQLRVYLVTSKPGEYAHLDTLSIVATDYSDDSLESAFEVIGSDVRTVICRQDKNIQYLIRIIPYLASDAFVSSPESLAAATSKRIMREQFARHCPEISPQFIKVHDADMEPPPDIHFPVIVKPASLASSLLIQKCEDSTALKDTLRQTLAVIKEVHTAEGRHEPPEVIVEEYMEGDFYSIDSYALDGAYFHTPLVSYVPAQSIGVDDFCLYRRTTPTTLEEYKQLQARITAEKAMQALCFRYTTAHIEMILTKDGWKIIEVGPRVGRFRELMYRASYGIEHGYNDLLVHCGLAPILDERSQKFTAAYSIYPSEEGVLEEITHHQDVASYMNDIRYERLDESKLRQPVAFAKNGGHALYEVVFTSENAEQFSKECEWFETYVHTRVA